MPSIESGGARIDYTVHGDGSSSSSVMLLAGFRAPATSWRYQIPSLIEAGHRVIAVDLPGHGTAPATPHGTTMQTRAGFVHALIEELDLQDVAIVGGSMGANTIWSYVDSYGTGRLRAAVVVDQTPRMLNTPEWAYGFYGYDQEEVDTFFADGIPVLFVAGSDSEYWPSAHAVAAAALAPNGASIVVPRAGHATNMERPHPFSKAVAEFFDSAS